MPLRLRLLPSITRGLYGLVLAGACLAAAEPVPVEQLTWRVRNERPLSQPASGILAGPDCFVVFGYGGMIARSENGVLWESVSLATRESLTSGEYADGEFRIYGGDLWLSSPDGRNWTQQRLPSAPDGLPPNIESAGRFGPRRAALTSAGIYVSDDGTHWDLWPLPEAAAYSRIAVGPDRMVCVKSVFPETRVTTVTARDQWTDAPAPFNSYDVAAHGYDRGLFFQIQSAQMLATSPDGVTWAQTTLPIPPGYVVPTLTRSGDYWVITSFGPTYWESTDMVHWSERPCDVFGSVSRVARRGPNVWVGLNWSDGVATSTDGSMWIRRDGGDVAGMHFIGRIGDRYVATGESGSILTSTDTVHWTTHVLDGEPSIIGAVYQEGGVYYVDAHERTYATTDGVSWTPGPLRAPEPLVLDDGGIPYTCDPRPVWAGDRWFTRGTYHTYGVGAIFSSFDRATWRRVLQTPLIVHSIAGRPGAYVASTAAELYFSADGANWELLQNPAFGYNAPHVLLAGSGWFIGGSAYGVVASRNGRDWAWVPGINNTILGGSTLGDSFWLTGAFGTVVEVMPFVEAPLANLSTRAYQRSGALPPIAGFIIEGPAPVDVLVRAVGAGLRAYDVADVVERPIIRLYAGAIETLRAGDWATSDGRAEIELATQRTGAFPLAEDGGDAAFTARLPAGAYTAVVEGGDVAQGNILVEVYDSASSDGTSGGGRLANSSTRGAATAEHPLIGGLIVKGDRPRRVLVRGIGPGLDAFAVPGAARDPQLRVFTGTTLIAENDDWEDGDDPLLVRDAAASVFAFPLASGAADAALVLTLAPGLYTAHVSPAPGTDGGEALLETYYLD